MNIVNTVKDHLETLRGQKVAVMAARYQYRGVLSEIGSEHIVLAHATSVEISGSASLEAPQTEDAIHGSIMIMLGAVEIVYQPIWSKASLPGGD